jgi:hypothetical protein
MSAGPLTAVEPRWFKSSYSGGNATECLETAFVPSGVLIRDSKHPHQGRVAVSADAWTGFLAGARSAQEATGATF